MNQYYFQDYLGQLERLVSIQVINVEKNLPEHFRYLSHNKDKKMALEKTKLFIRGITNGCVERESKIRQLVKEIKRVEHKFKLKLNQNILQDFERTSEKLKEIIEEKKCLV